MSDAHHYQLFDPLLSPADADAMVRLCERFGRYGLYSQEASESEIGQGLAQRHDAVLNYIKRSGRCRQRRAAVGAGGADELFPRIVRLRRRRSSSTASSPSCATPGFVDAARAVHGRPVIVPAIVYANILLPGQELAVHTDVPEFRGANRKKFPQWLMVAMHHSGLFDAWRMPIVTGVSWFSACAGGEFVFYPDGADGARVRAAGASATPPSCSTPTPCSTASIASASTPRSRRCAPACSSSATAPAAGACATATRVVARYAWDELRFSISWKAYCFADAAERRAWQRAQRRPRRSTPSSTAWSTTCATAAASPATAPPPPTSPCCMIDEYIKFPSA